MSQQINRPKFTTERKPGTGGFTKGIGVQQERLREEGAKVRRAEALRPTAIQCLTSMPTVKASAVC